MMLILLAATDAAADDDESTLDACACDRIRFRSDQWCKDGECTVRDDLDQHLMDNILDADTPYVREIEPPQLAMSAGLDQMPLPPPTLEVVNRSNSIASNDAKTKRRDSTVASLINGLSSTSTSSMTFATSTTTTGSPPRPAWSPWSTWSACQSECIEQTGGHVLGFQLSRRTCSACIPNEQKRFKLCDAESTCSPSFASKVTADRFVRNVCHLASQSDHTLTTDGTQYPTPNGLLFNR